MTPVWSRRTMLGILGGIVTMSGCTSGPSADRSQNSSTTATGGDDGPIKVVRVDGMRLVVEVAADAAIETVNVIAPDGSTFRSLDVATGATRVEGELGVNYQPGEYRILGVRDDTEVGQERLRIEPDVTIVRARVGANVPQRMPDALGTTSDEEAWVRVKNTGNGPAVIEALLFLEGVPNPTRELADVSETKDVSGIFDQEAGKGEVDQIQLLGNEQRDLISSTLPFSFQGEGVSCPETSTTEAFTVITRIRPQGKVSREFTAVYEPGTENGCTVSVQTGGP